MRRCCLSNNVQQPVTTPKTPRSAQKLGAEEHIECEYERAQADKLAEEIGEIAP